MPLTIIALSIIPLEPDADADTLSLIPLTQTCSSKSENVCFWDTKAVTIVNCEMIKRETQVEPVLFQVCKYVIIGWPYLDPSVMPFKTRQDELSTQQRHIL